MDFTNGFSVFFCSWWRLFNFFSRKKFFGFQNLDPLYRLVTGKPVVLEVLCLEVGTSVASALTAETVFESIKCMCDVDCRYVWPRAHGVKVANVHVFQFWLRPR